MIFTTNNGFHKEECLPLKGMVSTAGTSFHSNQWLLVMGMDSTIKEWLPLKVIASRKGVTATNKNCF